MALGGPSVDAGGGEGEEMERSTFFALVSAEMEGMESPRAAMTAHAQMKYMGTAANLRSGCLRMRRRKT